MATKISADIASIIDITARRNDSFYLKAELKNTDGTIYDIIDTSEADYTAHFEIYDANDVLILGFLSSTDSNSATVDSSIVVDGATATLLINSPATNMTIRSGSYKYKYYVKSGTDNVTNTVMVGKFKVVDI
mgnify:FL=1|tara:strand:- start:1424 stop:1819 length:396 start_codon:yes stop_codon:yes gene_type:complete